MLKNSLTWLPDYLFKPNKNKAKGLSHIIFCVVDHFEPKWGNPDFDSQRKRIDLWGMRYQKISLSHKDSDGSHPRHTFFYPQEEYEKEHLEKLATLCKQGFGEVEIHLHHDNDSAEGLKEKIEDFKLKLLNHDLLSQDKQGLIRYGFIHGNWALDNSRKDGRYCGVNKELEVLRDTGCYADFTLPSAPSDTQTAKINSIYYAKDTTGPKSHNAGVDVKAGREPSGDLMIIQGPLVLNWKRRKFGIFPKIENSGITLENPPTKNRIDLWVKQNICVIGKPEWIFIKVYTHGLQENNLTDGYFDNIDLMFSYLEEKYNNGIDFKLHYVTARQMYNIVKAAEAGCSGNPGVYRDFEIVSRVGKNNPQMRVV